LVFAVVGAVSLQAHPGHAPFSEGATHFLMSPVHVGPALLFSGVVFAVAQFLKRRAERVFLSGVAMLIALAAVLA
jgi:hypothetical protein